MSTKPDRHSLIPFFPALDGLRGIFAIAVLSFHAGMGFPGALLAMSGFFVLSGFLISALLVAEWQRDGRIDLVAFLMRRARRLLPAAFIAIGFVALFWSWLPLQTPSAVDPFERFWGDLLAATFYYYNWRRAFGPGWEGFRAFAWDDPPEPSPIAHLWSLSVEEQFYLLFPVTVLALLWIFRSRIAIAAASLLGIGAIVLFAPSLDGARGFEAVALMDRIYLGTDVRMAEILCGVLLAMVFSYPGPRSWIERSPLVGWAGAAALALLTLWWFTLSIGSWWLYEHGLLGIGVLYTMVVAAGTQPSGPVTALLDHRVLRWIGERSYGLYVYHYPIQRWLDEMVVDWDDWVLYAVRMALTVIVSMVSYTYVEMPIRRRIPPDAPWGYAAIGIAVVALTLASATIFGTPRYTTWCAEGHPCAVLVP